MAITKVKEYRVGQEIFVTRYTATYGIDSFPTRYSVVLKVRKEDIRSGIPSMMKTTVRELHGMGVII